MNTHRIENKKVFALLLTVLLLLTVQNPIYAQTDDPPDDSGVVDDQDSTKTDSIRWVLPHGDTFIVEDEEYNIVLDYEGLITSEDEVGNSYVTFVGLGETTIGDDGTSTTSTTCGNGNGRGKCLGQINQTQTTEEGAIPDSDCGDVWVTPGIVSMVASKNTPENPVVIGQDPDNTGVTIDYSITLEPTIVSYEKWQIIGHRFVACVEGEESSSEDYGIEESCPTGMYSLIEHIWGCAVREKAYKENIVNANAGVSLTAESRNWILGELSLAYPNAYLIQPDYFYGVSSNCGWVDNTCILNTTINFQVADPGYYDIEVIGSTSGTRVSPGRSFTLSSGQVGVFLIDSSGILN